MNVLDQLKLIEEFDLETYKHLAILAVVAKLSKKNAKEKQLNIQSKRRHPPAD